MYNFGFLANWICSNSRPFHVKCMTLKSWWTDFRKSENKSQKIKHNFFTEMPHYLCKVHWYSFKVLDSSYIFVCVFFCVFETFVRKSHQSCPNEIYSAVGGFSCIPSVLSNFTTWNIWELCMTQEEFFLAELYFFSLFLHLI